MLLFFIPLRIDQHLSLSPFAGYWSAIASVQSRVGSGSSLPAFFVVSGLCSSSAFGSLVLGSGASLSSVPGFRPYVGLVPAPVDCEGLLLVGSGSDGRVFSEIRVFSRSVG